MSVVDMVDMENQIGEVVDAFEEKMKTLYEEEPDSFAVPNEDGSMGRISEGEWKSQVTNCGLDLNEALCKVVEQFESKLHNGDYHREMREWQESAKASGPDEDYARPAPSGVRGDIFTREDR